MYMKIKNLNLMVRSLRKRTRADQVIWLRPLCFRLLLGWLRLKVKPTRMNILPGDTSQLKPIAESFRNSQVQWLKVISKASNNFKLKCKQLLVKETSFLQNIWLRAKEVPKFYKAQRSLTLKWVHHQFSPLWTKKVICSSRTTNLLTLEITKTRKR
jgi:hypothetical protein